MSNERVPVEPTTPTVQRFAIDALLLVVFLVGIAFLCEWVLVPCVHEVLGHGLAAKLLGGTFRSFSWEDRLADASLPRDAATWRLIVFHMAGLAATTIAGLVALLLALWTKEPWKRCGWFVVTIALLLSDPAAVFWNSLYPQCLGDGALAIKSTYSDVFPWILTAKGFALFVFGSIVGYGGLLRSVEAALGANSRLAPTRRAFVVLLFFLLPAADLAESNHLNVAPPMLVNLTQAALSLALGVLFFRWLPGSPVTPCPRSRPKMVAGAVLSWGAALIAVAVTTTWLPNEVVVSPPRESTGSGNRLAIQSTVKSIQRAWTECDMEALVDGLWATELVERELAGSVALAVAKVRGSLPEDSATGWSELAARYGLEGDDVFAELEATIAAAQDSEALLAFAESNIDDTRQFLIDCLRLQCEQKEPLPIADATWDDVVLRGDEAEVRLSFPEHGDVTLRLSSGAGHWRLCDGWP